MSSAKDTDAWTHMIDFESQTVGQTFQGSGLFDILPEGGRNWITAENAD
jgi:hypothetical protein